MRLTTRLQTSFIVGEVYSVMFGAAKVRAVCVGCEAEELAEGSTTTFYQVAFDIGDTSQSQQTSVGKPAARDKRPFRRTDQHPI